MVGLRRAKTLLFVVLVVMATTIANGAKMLTENDKDEPSKGSGETIDVKASGAKGDGKTDDSKAFADAWKKACESKSPSKIKVRKGKYLVKTLEFKGPCKSAVTFEMDGHIMAPSKATPGKPHCGWINFEKLENFNLNGHGAIFVGQGAHAWKINDCAKTGKCNTLPINIRITGLTNSKIKGIKSTNSKLFHMNIINCKNLTLEDIGIDAPPESLNTDGIHIGRSDGVRLVRAKIKTGDDCISIGDGTENFLVENVECGPGHGIAIGSLGKYPNEQPVRGVTIRRSLIKNTDNGVRIKTWPGSPPGIVSNILFQDITMDNVSLPILIDQVYCPHGHCKKGGPSKVKLSDITYRDIKGTSASKVAVKLLCSPGVPCTNVTLSNIDFVYTGKRDQLFRHVLTSSLNSKERWNHLLALKKLNRILKVKVACPPCTHPVWLRRFGQGAMKKFRNMSCFF